MMSRFWCLFRAGFPDYAYLALGIVLAIELVMSKAIKLLPAYYSKLPTVVALGMTLRLAHQDNACIRRVSNGAWWSPAQDMQSYVVVRAA